MNENTNPASVSANCTCGSAFTYAGDAKVCDEKLTEFNGKHDDHVSKFRQFFDETA